MTVITRVVAIALLVIGLTVVTASAQQGQPPKEQQTEYVPIDELPPQDQLPAAPLLIGAYAFVVVALFGYVFSIARRLGTVQREVERLESDMKKSARG
jgi:CcmD family protein